MKVAGFTIIRNAIIYDFPIVEAIMSILPICDEFIVSVGNSEDGTLDLIKGIKSNKIKIIESIWDDSLKGKKGVIFAKETDKAMKNISKDVDWAFYIQADEVVHEKYLTHIKEQMGKYKNDKNIDGLLFKYKHFLGDYKYYGGAYWWYRREIRIVRNNANIYSYKDAQSFRKGNNKKLNVKLLDAEIFHYGFVRDPAKLTQKVNFQNSCHEKKAEIKKDPFNYNTIDYLKIYKGSHPSCIKERMNKKNWDFEYDLSNNKRVGIKENFKHIVYKLTGYIIGEFKNYKIIK